MRKFVQRHHFRLGLVENRPEELKPDEIIARIREAVIAGNREDVFKLSKLLVDGYDDRPVSDTELLRLRQVARILTISPRSVWRLVAIGELPAPVRVSPRERRWLGKDIKDYRARIETQRG
jgi:predicted DNA-binding transcriptional regulator AlpA